MRETFLTESVWSVEPRYRSLAARVKATSQQKFARSRARLALDKTPNIFAPPLRSALLTTYTRSLTATFHREKREDSYFRAAPSALDREAAACVAIRPKDFDASSQLRVLINGGIIQDESFLT